MRVDFTDRALRDLTAIGDWIARDDPDRAYSYIGELERRALSLAAFPLQCPFYRRSRRGAVRKCVHGNYHMFYVAHRDRIEVLHYRHGAQRPPRF